MGCNHVLNKHGCDYGGRDPRAVINESIPRGNEAFPSGPLAKIVADNRGIVTNFKGQARWHYCRMEWQPGEPAPEEYAMYVRDNEDGFNVSGRWAAESCLTDPRIGKMRRVLHMKTMREALIREQRESERLGCPVVVADVPTASPPKLHSRASCTLMCPNTCGR